MALVIRVDVDRPYGRSPWPRHVLSRLSSDLYFPRIVALGFLAELARILSWLNERGAPAYVFFRMCTLPSQQILELLDAGGHEIGLHLENSRSFTSFIREREILERHVGKKIQSFSKHGSGGTTHGLHHYAPYEPEKYLGWAKQGSMRLFLGNLEDPSIGPTISDNHLIVFPSAFWLEPAWRNTQTFSVDWLLDHAKSSDIVLLVHPENVLAQPRLIADFTTLITALEAKIFR